MIARKDKSSHTTSKITCKTSKMKANTVQISSNSVAKHLHLSSKTTSNTGFKPQMIVKSTDNRHISSKI